MSIQLTKRFTAGELKLLAMLSMFCDHAALIFLLDLSEASAPAAGIYDAMRLFGRMAFPLYVFFLVEGFFRTRNRKKYALRLVILGLVSEMPYNLMVSGSLFYMDAQNTVWLLLAGLLAMTAMEKIAEKEPAKKDNAEKKDGRLAGESMLGILIRAVIAAAGMFLSWALCLDYGAYGFLLIMVMYWWHTRPDCRMIAGYAVILVMYMDFFAVPALFAFFFINRYNGEKGWNLGKIPYLFYPAHVMLLVGIRYIINFL